MSDANLFRIIMYGGWLLCGIPLWAALLTGVNAPPMWAIVTWVAGGIFVIEFSIWMTNRIL